MSQENTCVGVSFSQSCRSTLLRRLRHKCFPVNFVKFLKTSFLKNNSGRLLQQKIHFWKVDLVFQLIFIWKRDLFISKLSETWNQFSKTVISVCIKAILCGVRSYYVEFIIKTSWYCGIHFCFGEIDNTFWKVFVHTMIQFFSP